MHRNDTTCENNFHQMLYWEHENPANGAVHHLTVLCYHLQHPHLYSQRGLEEGMNLLVEFVERGTSLMQIRKQNAERVNSKNRNWNIKASADSHGAYIHPVHWTMTGVDVVAGGIDNYCENVRAWAESMLKNLQETENIK